jgi:hypothetical protein
VPHSLKSARLRSLLDHYRSVARNGSLPRRADIDPVQMIPAMPYTYIAQVEFNREAQSEFRLQLFGTELVQLFGAELTGEQVCRLDMGDWGTEWRSTLRYAMRTRLPVAAIHRLEVIRHLPITIEHVALPLSSDGVQVDRLIGAIDLLDEDRESFREHMTSIDWSHARRVNDAQRSVPD